MSMSIFKKLLVIPCMLLLTNAHGQMHYGIGYTGAWLYSKASIAGGFAFYAGRNIAQTHNSSLSISTNAKIGIEDKIGTGIIVPGLIALVADNNTAVNNINKVSTSGANGGTIHLFADLPLLLHYNFGLGANNEHEKAFGFYLGGGITYIKTGYTDTLGYSRGTGFFGYVMDGGVRIARERNIDINFSNVVSLRKPIGQIKYPVLSEITLSLLLEHRSLKKHRHR